MSHVQIEFTIRARNRDTHTVERFIALRNWRREAERIVEDLKWPNRRFEIEACEMPILIVRGEDVLLRRNGIWQWQSRLDQRRPGSDRG